ncbi:hypothetical protein L218DRAFT_871741, partial [Marasmius fiardii PR-910]
VSCGNLDLKFALLKELNGSGDGKNLEQLFATGFAGQLSASFGNQFIAQNQGKTEMAQKAKVRVSVHVGEPQNRPGEFGLDVPFEGVDEDLLKEEFCPYARLTREGRTVRVSRK